MHDVSFSHGHSEQMFETSCQYDSLQEYLDVQMIFKFRMVVDFTKISHVETLFVEGL